MCAAFALGDPDIQRNPFDAYRSLRVEAPVLDVGGKGTTFVLSRFEDVSAALRDPATFSSAILPVPVMMFLDPPDHERIRRTVSRAFTPKAVAELAPRIEALAASLLDPYVAAAGGDFVGAFAARLPVYVVGEVLGVPIDDFEQLRHWSDDTIRALGGDSSGASGTLALAGYLDEVANASRSVAPDSIAARLVALEHEGAMDRRELVSFLQFLFVAGHETTMAMFTHGAELLAGDHDLLRHLDADRALVPLFVEEVLRTRSPLQRVFRRTTRGVTIGGVAIPAGASVCLLLGSANRDAARFAAGDGFDLDRAEAAHLAFGQGIHHCLGAPLARLEGRIGFRALLDRASSWILDPDHPPVRFAGGTTSEYQSTTLHLRLS